MIELQTNRNRSRHMPYLVFFILLVLPSYALSEGRYQVQPGDELNVSVWKEPDLTGQLTVHPDGMFSMPLIGEIPAAQRSILDIQGTISEKLKKFVPDAIVTVGLQRSVGVSIYVIGQVNTPGVFAVTKPIDVMQALSLAQGMTAYASKSKIKILRRETDGQVAIKFNFGEVAKGVKLDQNIVLQNGDVVVVP